MSELQSKSVLSEYPTTSTRDLVMPPRFDSVHVPDHLCLDTTYTVHSLIDGRAIEPQGAVREVYSPLSLDGGSTHPKIGSYPLCSSEQALAALESAQRAYDGGLGAWAQASAGERIELTSNFIDRLESIREEVVKLLVWEIAKTEDQACSEFDRTVSYLRETLDEYRRMLAEGATPVHRDGIRYTTSHGPIGVVLCMGPFNYPLNECLTILIPAILVGNTAILKTHDYGSIVFAPIVKLLSECYPAGVLNVISGDGREIISPLMKSGGIDALGFIGSAKVADILIDQHPEKGKIRGILGLGAKNQAIVLPHADIDKAVGECVKGALSFNGQRCTALKHIFVHDSIADDFVARLSRAVNNLRVGQAYEAGVSITPLAEPGKVQKMQELIEDSVTHGALVQNVGGGEAHDNLMKPAVVFPVTKEMRLFHEEQFGPIVAVSSFSNVDQVVQAIKDSPYAQQVSLFGEGSTGDHELRSTLLKLTTRLNLNTQCQRGPDFLPFGGKKSSARGAVSIRGALLEFSVEVPEVEIATEV